MDNNEVTLRPAYQHDAQVAAELIILSMGKEAEAFLDREHHRSASEVVAELFARIGGRFSHAVATVANTGRQPAGLLLAFPAHHIFQLDWFTGIHLLEIFGLGEMVRLVSRIFPYSLIREAEQDEYYISNVAVLPRFQRHGIGNRLLAHAEELARVSGLKKCSLMVGFENYHALGLYERRGYRIVTTKQLPFNHGMGFHRMVKSLLAPAVPLENG